MRYFVTVRERTFEVEVAPDGLRVDGTAVEAELVPIPGTGTHSLLLDGASHRLVARRETDDAWNLTLDGETLLAEVIDQRTRAIRAMAGAGKGSAGPRPVRAPMPGLVVKVEVEEGDQVAEGDGMVIMEAMKMENELRAEAPARVKTIRIREGEPVEKDQILIELGPDEG